MTGLKKFRAEQDSNIELCHTNTYILLTKREGRTGRISARGLDSTDLAVLGPYKKDRGPIFFQYGPEQAWLIRDLLHNWNCLAERPKW